MKLRKLLLTVFAVLFVGFGTAFAQEVEGPFSIEDLNNPGIENNNEAQEKFGISYFLTSGIENQGDTPENGGNVAIIEQVGDSHKANLSQDGNNIYGAIIQHGFDHKADLNQTGNNLRSVINMEGTNHYLQFDQTANNRDAFFELTGSNLEFTASQTNSHFTLEPQNSSMPAIDIETTRQSLPIIISNN